MAFIALVRVPRDSVAVFIGLSFEAGAKELLETRKVNVFIADVLAFTRDYKWVVDLSWFVAGYA